VPEEQADIPAKDEHNGPTLEHDAREAINTEIPLRAAAAPMPRAPRVTDKPAPVERTDEQWEKWLDKLRDALAVLYRRSEVTEIAERESIKDAIKSSPPFVQREISRLLAENFARLPAEDEPDDLPEVEIVGGEKMAAG